MNVGEILARYGWICWPPFGLWPGRSNEMIARKTWRIFFRGCCRTFLILG
jgi:hypothetical protein